MKELPQEPNLQEKIHYYNNVRHCIPFRSLYHTVKVVCEWVEPLNQRINTDDYIEYFLDKIDFDKLSPSLGDSKVPKDESLEYCYSIYYGLEEIFRRDINQAIINYQNDILRL